MAARRGRWIKVVKTKLTSCKADVLDWYLRYAGRSPADGWAGKPQRGCAKEKMKIHRPHHKERTKQWLKDCINLDSRRATKTGQTKDNMERTAERGRQKAGWKNWSEVQITATDRAGWWDSVEALCATWHEEDRWRWRKIELLKIWWSFKIRIWS